MPSLGSHRDGRATAVVTASERVAGVASTVVRPGCRSAACSAAVAPESSRTSRSVISRVVRCHDGPVSHPDAE